MIKGLLKNFLIARDCPSRQIKIIKAVKPAKNSATSTEVFIIKVTNVCQEALMILGVRGLNFRPMNRRKAINPKKGYVLGRTNLKTGLITIDIFTAKNRKPKKISSILRTLCHEVAHHQKPPYRQFYKFRWINRQHYPQFYMQVDKNIKKLKKSVLEKFF